MSESMIERVARALADYEGNGHSWEGCIGPARAAIEAMREPTDAMVGCLVGYEEADWERREGWQAAIDAALSEKP